MAEIEKVIRGLKCLTNMSDCTTCPYSYNKQREFCLCDIGKDATELLKEQTVKPFLIREGRSKYYNDYHCPRCDEEIFYEQNYCSECGSRIDWSN